MKTVNNPDTGNTNKLYLVTDPCYVISDHDKWLEALETHGYDGGWENVQCDIGVILTSANTSNGDGSVKVSGDKEVSADAGLSCIVEITDVDKYDPIRHGNATTRTLGVAEHWLNIAITRM